VTTCEQFPQRLRRYCHKSGLRFEVLPDHGKGSHYRVRVGERETTVPAGDVSPVMRGVILKQLGFSKDTQQDI
jgi:hypothetical protein